MRALFEVLSDWRKSTTLPNVAAVGAKIRLGNTAREQHFRVYLPVAEAAAETGLDYLTVHARNGEQRSRDPPTWEAIGEIKDAVQQSDIKIIGNGNVRTSADVVRMRELTGCDGVMIGRAAMRNPWVFRQLTRPHDDGSEWPTPDEVERAAAENEAWSAHQRAAARYRRFRQENFERLRREASSPGGGEEASDWYLAWSQAATRRRHLDQLDDEEEAARRRTDGSLEEPLGHGSIRRTSNTRDWRSGRRHRKRHSA